MLLVTLQLTSTPPHNTMGMFCSRHWARPPSNICRAGVDTDISTVRMTGPSGEAIVCRRLTYSYWIALCEDRGSLTGGLFDTEAECDAALVLYLKTNPCSVCESFVYDKM